jgi:hypothetical protein
VQRFLFEHAARRADELRAVGKYRPQEHGGDGETVPRGLGPEDILVVVAGGDGGGHSAFIPSWSRGRNSLMQTRRIPAAVTER